MGSPNHLIYLETVLPNFNGKVLEVGANNNKFRHKGYFQNLGAEYTGTDLVPGPDVDVDCDLTQDDNPLPKNHFDLVMCCSVMEHVPNPWDMARCISALVAPGGKLYISVPWVWRYHAYPDDYYRFTFSAIEYLFPNFTWSNFAYSTELSGDIRWIQRGEVGRDNKWAYKHVRDDGQVKKYLPYLMIDLLGTKNVS